VHRELVLYCAVGTEAGSAPGRTVYKHSQGERRQREVSL